MLEMAVAMGVGSFIDQGRREREPFFSRGGRVAGIRSLRRLKRSWERPFGTTTIGTDYRLHAYTRLPVQLAQPGEAGRATSRLARLAPAGPGPRARYRSSTKRTAAAIVTPVVSRITASAAGANGATARSASRASRSRISRKRLSIVLEIPFSINCLCRRSARSSWLAVRNTLRLRVREDHGAHVASVGHEARGDAGRPFADRARRRARPHAPRRATPRR